MFWSILNLPWVVAVHHIRGMAESTQRHYMRRAAARFHARGHAVLAVNHRGAGEGMGWSRDFYHGGSTKDMAAALHFGRERIPGHLQVAIGYSISASILLPLLGRDSVKGVTAQAIGPQAHSNPYGASLHGIS